jgi:hypothetical protein
MADAPVKAQADSPESTAPGGEGSASFQLAFLVRSQAGSLRYIGRPPIVRLWKFLLILARQRHLQTGPLRE